MSPLSQKSAAAHRSWVEHPSGYEHTTSPQIMRQTLAWIRDNRIFVTLLHKGYQSGGCLLVELGDKGVALDKPRDWPGSKSSVRVIFRNNAGLWCHFSGKVVGATTDTLLLPFPSEMFMLQRRRHFRVNTPSGSCATFLYNGEKCKLNVENISAGGMLISGKAVSGLPEQGSTIKEVMVAIPKTGDDEGEFDLPLAAADVVRVFSNEATRLLYFGIRFSLRPTDEDRLLKYIRQRELTMLRCRAQ